MRAALAVALAAGCGGSIPLVGDWCAPDEWSCGFRTSVVEIQLPTATVRMIPDLVAVFDGPGRLPALIDGAELEARRIAGETQVAPSDETIVMLMREGRARAIVTLAFCVAPDGTTSDVHVLRSSQYDQYDDALVAAVSRWRYAPLPACSAATFVVSLR